MPSTQFTIKSLPRLVFGRGCLQRVPEMIRAYGDTALIITGARSFRASSLWRDFEEALARSGVEYYHERVPGEPSPEMVDSITAAHSHRVLAVVVAIGGGSVLDCGKAVAAMLTCEGSVALYLEGVGEASPAGTTKPFIAVPTTAGTGSEATSNAVLSRVGPAGFKKSLRHENFVPDAAVIDPDLAALLPHRLAVHSAMDALSQLVESYLSTKANPFTDDLAFGALRRLAPSLRRLLHGAGGESERADMAYGAFISGITLSHAGLGLVHGFASTIGGRFPLPHGLVCATLMAACNDASLKKLRSGNGDDRALGKYAALGRLFVGGEDRGDDYCRDGFIAVLEQITHEGEIERLGRYGIGEDDLEDLARDSGCKNNPVEFNTDEKRAILAARL